MGIEDATPKKSELETLKKEKNVIAEPSTIPIDEDPTQTPEAKAEREQARLNRVQELREKLGLEREESSTAENKDTSLEEDRENISKQINLFAGDLEEISQILSRNKFPRVNFDTDQLKVAVKQEKLEPKVFLQEIDNLYVRIGRIQLPESTRDRMELDPHKFRNLISAMEDLRDKSLHLLKSSFEQAKSKDLQEIAPAFSRIRSKISSKIDDFEDALSALRRYNDR